jgi:formate-nitrite transporter family protein
MSLDPPVDPQRDHIRGGSAPGAVDLVEYGDFECPYCGDAFPAVQQVQAVMGERLAFVFRHFPLVAKHPHALRAAEAAEAAGAQGRFWEMHDLLFQRQRHLEDSDLRVYAAELALDLQRFDAEMETGVHLPRIEEDIESGRRSGVRGTPTFFIAGQRYDGFYDLESLLDALEEAAAAR